MRILCRVQTRKTKINIKKIGANKKVALKTDFHFWLFLFYCGPFHLTFLNGLTGTHIFPLRRNSPPAIFSYFLYFLYTKLYSKILFYFSSATSMSVICGKNLISMCKKNAIAQLLLYFRHHWFYAFFRRLVIIIVVNFYKRSDTLGRTSIIKAGITKLN